MRREWERKTREEKRKITEGKKLYRKLKEKIMKGKRREGEDKTKRKVRNGAVKRMA